MKEKHIAGWTLYMEGWAQNRIAKTLGVAEKTVAQWKVKYNWDERRVQESAMRDTATEQLMGLINFQLEVLGRIKEKQRDGLDELDIQGLNSVLIQNGQIDALYKMFAAVKGKEQTWASYVKVLREFTEFVSKLDIAQAKAIAPMVDDFLNQKRRELA